MTHDHTDIPAPLVAAILEAAVEAAAEATYDQTTDNRVASWDGIDPRAQRAYRNIARSALSAALPHLAGQPLGVIHGAFAATPPPAAPELDQFSAWFDQRANDEYGKVVVYDFGRDEDDDRVRSMAEAVAQFRASQGRRNDGQ